jgi:CTP synthase
VPWIAAAGELKTKPTQHSVKKLREIGIQPDILLCRADRPSPTTSAQDRAVHQRPARGRDLDALDVDTIYKVPRMLHDQGSTRSSATSWACWPAGRPVALGTSWSTRSSTRRARSTSPFVGKYVDLTESYKSLNEALRHAGIHNHAARSTSTTSTPRPSTADGRGALAKHGRHPGARRLRQARHRGQDRAIRYARENKVPYLGICLGMQVATIEFARHVAGWGANSTEFEPDTPHPVIALITEWQDRDGAIEKRDASSDLGGTMRLGAQSSDVKPGTLAHRSTAPWSPSATATATRPTTTSTAAAGRPGDLGAHAARDLTEIVELPQSVHPWFVGVQFHPEFTSTPWDGHPLFIAFVKAALATRRAGA